MAEQKRDLMDKQRFLFVVNVDWFFVSHRLPIAKALIEQGHEVHIATHITDKRPQMEEIGLVVHPVTLNRGSMSPFGMLFYFIALARLIKSLRPDILHLVTIKPVLFGGLAARMARESNVVAAISGLGSTFLADNFLARLRLRFILALYRAALKQKNLKVIFQNDNDRQILQSNTNLNDDQIAMIRGSGVDLSLYDPTPADNDNPIILFASRLLREKGVEDFVEASRIIKQEGKCDPEPRFVIVGAPDPDNPSSISDEEIEQWVSEGVIDYWGHQTDMPAVLAKSDLVVFPSYYGEGLPKILIEAAAAGRPVITTDHPGCRDAIEEGRTGLLMPVRDPMALAKAIKNVVDDPLSRQQMGQNGHKLAKHTFAIEHILNAHLTTYEQLNQKNEGKEFFNDRA